MKTLKNMIAAALTAAMMLISVTACSSGEETLNEITSEEPAISTSDTYPSETESTRSEEIRTEVTSTEPTATSGTSVSEDTHTEVTSTEYTTTSSTPVSETVTVSSEETRTEVTTTKPVTTTTTSAAPVSETATVNSGKIRTGMTSAEFAADMGLGINLGNTMEAYWAGSNKTSGAQTIGGNTPGDYERCWGAVTTTQKAIDGMKAAGFKTVRIPVYWGNMMADDGKFIINEQYFKRVEEIIKYCFNDGLYAVINIHHFDGFIIENYSKEETLKITEKLWKQIAERFKNYSDYLIFEGFNESLGQQREEDKYSQAELFDYVNAMNKTFVDAVRSTGGNNKYRMLIISGYWTNIDLTTKDKFIIPKDVTKDRIMVSVHYADNAMYWSNKIGGKEWLDYSRSQCELLKKAFSDKGIQVFMGECTSIYDSERFANNADITDSSTCLETILQMELDYGFIPVLWDVNNNFYSRTAYRIISDSDAAVISRLSAEKNR